MLLQSSRQGSKPTLRDWGDVAHREEEVNRARLRVRGPKEVFEKQTEKESLS